MIYASVFALGAVVARSPAACADEGGAAPSVDRGIVTRAFGTRLSVGVRLSHLWLEDSRRYGEDGLDNGNGDVNFLGSLWGLDPQQGYIPGPVLEYRVVAGFGAGAAYDESRIKTLDWADDEHTRTAGDGDLRIRGVQLYAFARIRNRSRVTPFVRGGYSWYSSAFFESPGWALPGRYFEVEDTQGWFGGAGVTIGMMPHLGVDVSFEHSWLSDVDARARFPTGRGKAGAFPVAATILRAGVACTF